MRVLQLVLALHAKLFSRLVNKKGDLMRLFASLVAWLNVLVLVARIFWPEISEQPFPLPGYQNISTGTTLVAIAFAAIFFAVWVSVFWNYARSHQLLFTLLSGLCFLWGALFFSVSIGFGFAVLSVLVRSR